MSSRAFIRILSLHAAGVCLGTIQARTHVQLALVCQRSMIFAQRKLRLTMQHVYGHNGNLGNECPCRRTWDFMFYIKPQRYHSLVSTKLMLLCVLMAVTALMRS